MTVRWQMVAALAAGSSLVALGGCAGASTITQEHYGSYSRAIVGWVGADRDVAVEVKGAVPGLDRPALEAAVERGLVGAGGLPNARFTTKPGPSAARDYRVVLLFGTDAAGGAAVCSAPASGAGSGATAAGRGLRVAAAFCYRDEALSSLDASSRPAAVTPEAVTNLVSDLSPILLPEENPYLQRPSPRTPG